MPDKAKERPWWKKKTNIGLILYAVGETMALIPVTMPFSPIVKAVGGILAGYGISDRINKSK